jgi:hypothetical protein
MFGSSVGLEIEDVCRDLRDLMDGKLGTEPFSTTERISRC